MSINTTAPSGSAFEGHALVRLSPDVEARWVDPPSELHSCLSAPIRPTAPTHPIRWAKSVCALGAESERRPEIIDGDLADGLDTPGDEVFGQNVAVQVGP